MSRIRSKKTLGHVERGIRGPAGRWLAVLAAVTAAVTGIIVLNVATPEPPVAGATVSPADRAILMPDSAHPAHRAAPTAPIPPAGWTLEWNDEFSGTALNRAYWDVEDDSTYGDGNNELACLLDRPANVSVAGGELAITARREAASVRCGRTDRRFPDGRSYTSGMVSTKGKVAFEYGRFEIRARTPTSPGTSKGLWPAFWMRPVDGDIGEIDILEILGTGTGTGQPGANRVYQTILYDYVGTYRKQSRAYDLPTGSFSDGFHTFAIEWEPGSISWFVDGALTYRRTAETTPWLDEAFVGDFYLRLNLAVGGDWPGAPDADTSFPARFQVDYVRVYRR